MHKLLWCETNKILRFVNALLACLKTRYYHKCYLPLYQQLHVFLTRTGILHKSIIRHWRNASTWWCFNVTGIWAWQLTLFWLYIRRTNGKSKPTSTRSFSHWLAQLRYQALYSIGCLILVVLKMVITTLITGNKVRDVGFSWRKRAKQDETIPLMAERTNTLTPSSSDGETSNSLGFGRIASSNERVYDDEFCEYDETRTNKYTEHAFWLISQTDVGSCVWYVIRFCAIKDLHTGQYRVTSCTLWIAFTFLSV